MSILPCSFIFLLLLCLPILTEAKKQQGKPDKSRQPPSSPPPLKRPRNRSVPGSGELTTKGGHRCTWQTSGDGLVSLVVNCSIDTLGEQQRYWCRYVGKPDLCPSYGVKSSPYWKQLVGKLKKRQNACDGEKVLKARNCKKAPAEAHMKLATRSGDGEEDLKKGGRKKGAAVGGKAERRKKKEEEEDEKKKREERTGFEEDGMMNDMEQSYCSEGWNTVCSFFVKFFEG